jgi:hypothetical protein
MQGRTLSWKKLFGHSERGRIMLARAIESTVHDP